MVTGFGWSAGDIATAIRAIYKITRAFREAGGASEQYAETVTFLEALTLTLNRLKDYVDANPSGKYKDDIDEQARRIKVEFDKLHTHIQNYDRLASSTSPQNQAQEARDKLKWAIDQLRNKVSKMKDGVSVPLQFLHTFLSLQILDDIKAVDSRLKQVSDTARSNDSSLKAAITSQQTLLAAIQTGLEGKITNETESLRQSHYAHSANTLDALQQLSRDVRSTQDSIDRRLAQLDPAELLVELNEQKELILKMRDAVDTHLLDLLRTLKSLESKKRSPEWLPLVQTACAAFAAAIGLANFVLQRSMTSNLKPSDDDGTLQPKTDSTTSEQTLESKFMAGGTLEEDPIIADPNTEQDEIPKKTLQRRPQDESAESTKISPDKQEPTVIAPRSNEEDREGSDDVNKPRDLLPVSISKPSVVPALPAESSEPSLSSTSSTASSPDHSTPNDADVSYRVVPNADRNSYTVGKKKTPQTCVITSSTKQSTSRYHSESRALGSGLSMRSSPASIESRRSRQAPQYAPSRHPEPSSREPELIRSSQNYSSHPTSSHSGYSGGGGGYSTSSYYSSYSPYSPPSPPSRPAYHQTRPTPKPPSPKPQETYRNTWSYPLTAYYGASARITAPTPSYSTPYHTAPSTSYGGPASISSERPKNKQHPATGGVIWMCCHCKRGPEAGHSLQCSNCAHDKCAHCKITVDLSGMGPANLMGMGMFS